jgi:DNA-binding transcriptional ArsR family regulator
MEWRRAPLAGTCASARTIDISGKSQQRLDIFHNSIIIELFMESTEDISRYADMLAAMGNESRLRITQLLLTAHPQGLVVSELQQELQLTPSNLSHHLDKLRHEGVVQVKREGTYLRYTANTKAIEALLGFIYNDCCSRSGALASERIFGGGNIYGKPADCC